MLEGKALVRLPLYFYLPSGFYFDSLSPVYSRQPECCLPQESLQLRQLTSQMVQRNVFERQGSDLSV